MRVNNRELNRLSNDKAWVREVHSLLCRIDSSRVIVTRTILTCFHHSASITLTFASRAALRVVSVPFTASTLDLDIQVGARPPRHDDVQALCLDLLLIHTFQ